MRIAILANADIGLYKFRKELVEKLCENNDVYILLPEGEFIESLKALGCRFIPLKFDRRGMNPIDDLKLIFKYLNLLKNIRPDLALTYTIKPNIYGGIACQLLKIPYLVNITGLGTALENKGILRWISMNLYKAGLRKADCAFFQNQKNYDVFCQQDITKGKTRLIPGSGVNLQVHRFEPYPVEDGKIRFLFVGRLMRDKGIEEFVSAMISVHRRNELASADIVGWCDEDYSSLLNQAEAEGTVRFHGLQADVRPFYARCHCCVLPSYHEGMANVLLEASAAGRPVIATRVPGCQETFEEGITGFGCEARSVESLEAAMLKFMSIPQEQREQMGKAAREKMCREFDRELVLKAYTEEIDTIASSRMKA